MSAPRLRLAARTVASLALTAAVGLGLSVPAQADTTDDSVHTLLARVHSLQVQTTGALLAYQQAMDSVAGSVTSDLDAQQASTASQAAAAAAQGTVDDRVRALYMSDGDAGMLSSVLGGDISDIGGRVVTVQRVLDATRSDARAAQQQAAAAQQTATTAHQRATGGVATARDVLAAATRLSGLLAQQQQLLAHAKAAQAAKARAELAAEQARAAAATAAGGRATGPLPASAAYLALYKAAAPTCPGLSWGLLAAVGQVESGHGRNVSTSSAGAQGPMQFLPATFAAYAVDGDHDGRTDIMDPADAIFTAAHFLCVHGAGQGPAGVQRALFAYNHAQWYVDLVLAVAKNYT